MFIGMGSVFAAIFGYSRQSHYHEMYREIHRKRIYYESFRDTTIPQVTK